MKLAGKGNENNVIGLEHSKLLEDIKEGSAGSRAQSIEHSIITGFFTARGFPLPAKHIQEPNWTASHERKDKIGCL